MSTKMRESNPSQSRCAKKEQNSSVKSIAALLSLLLTFAHAQLEQCDASSYCAAASAHASLDQRLPLAGLTRSVVEPFRYALLTPESRVYGSPPPGWQGPVSAAAVVTPALGAHFAMYLVNASVGASSPVSTTFRGAPPHMERLLYVLDGTVLIKDGSDGEQSLSQGGYVYYSPGDKMFTSIGAQGASFVLLDRSYAGIHSPASGFGHEDEVEEELCDGEVFRLRRLLNASDPTFDFNVHIMDFSPGEYLNVKEVHYNQHGLLMLRGHGIYMLGERFFPVTTGDVIFMAPFVPQWYAALGTEQTRYFLYKDTNVNPLVQ